MDKSFLKLSQKHARMTCYNMMHVKLFHGIALQVHGACKGQPNQTLTEVWPGRTLPKTRWNGKKTS